jgi:hypothetical protein
VCVTLLLADDIRICIRRTVVFEEASTVIPAVKGEPDFQIPENVRVSVGKAPDAVDVSFARLASSGVTISKPVGWSGSEPVL